MFSRVLSALLLLGCLSVAAATNAAGTAFLEQKAKEEGVVVLESGLQYKVLKSGPADGPSPEANTPCDVHYKGTLIDGTEFDSSYKRGTPTTFAPNQVVKGWTEALQLMKQGDHWELYIPSELAYGDRGVGAHIKAGDALVFQLELLTVKAGQSARSPILELFHTPIAGGFELWHVLAILAFVVFRSGAFSGSSGSKASASHILVKSQAKAEELKAQIQGGASFEAVAKEHSTCPSSQKGGALGKFGRGAMVPAFDKVIFDPETKVGQVYGPVETQFGFHLIKVTERDESKKGA
jgi:FKBP-type peptidyl-prolyl cis-trans isomerase FklB